MDTHGKEYAKMFGSEEDQPEIKNEEKYFVGFFTPYILHEVGEIRPLHQTYLTGDLRQDLSVQSHSVDYEDRNNEICLLCFEILPYINSRIIVRVLSTGLSGSILLALKNKSSYKNLWQI